MQHLQDRPDREAGRPRAALPGMLRQFIGRFQEAAILEGLSGEEAAFFRGKMADLSALIEAMPKTYEQEARGEQAVVHLHYFRGISDFYITERDSDPDGAGQVQAFGLADLFGDGGELGYISIPEIIAAGVELDLYWTPRTLAEVRRKRRAR